MAIEVLVAAFVVMGASLIGVVFLGKIAQQFLETKLSYLVSFSSGVFLVTGSAIALEALELTASWWQGALYVAVGYALAWLLHALLPETHHHHDEGCHRGHGGARKLLIGDAIHNFTDGIILVPAFAVSPALGVAATVSIFVHELLQELAEFFVLRKAGYSVKRALVINFAVSSTVLLGVAFASLLLATAALEGLLLALSAGFILHVVLHDLLPRPSGNGARHYGVHVVLVVLGTLLMLGVGRVLGDTHLHGGVDDHHDHHGEEVHHDEHDMHDGHAVHDEVLHDLHMATSAELIPDHHDHSHEHGGEVFMEAHGHDHMHDGTHDHAHDHPHIQ